MLDKLITPPTAADAETLDKIAGKPNFENWLFKADPLPPIQPELSPLEHVEALVSGIHGHLTSIRSLLRKHKDLSIATLEKHFDVISDDAMNLAVKAARHGRGE